MVRPTTILVPAAGLALLLSAHLLWKQREFSNTTALTDPARWGGAVVPVVPPSPNPPLATPSIPWSVMQPPVQTERAGGRLAERFSLIGMYVVFGGDEAQAEQRAVLADASTKREEIVQIGDKIDQVLVKDIQTDHIILSDALGEETLRLGSTGRPGDVAGEPAVATPSQSFGGRRLGPRRWEFDRRTLIGYYRDLMNNPDRLVQVFDSMKPVYEADGKISGYRLEVEGEKEFFEAAGLEPGDVVRKVNDLNMSNRDRAEFFIKQFVLKNVSVFVLDIERGGEPVRMLYQVRE